MLVGAGRESVAIRRAQMEGGPETDGSAILEELGLQPGDSFDL
jgi:hypothetical protein